MNDAHPDKAKSSKYFVLNVTIDVPTTGTGQKGTYQFIWILPTVISPKPDHSHDLNAGFTIS
jgi:hypothetical protein